MATKGLAETSAGVTHRLRYSIFKPIRRIFGIFSDQNCYKQRNIGKQRVYLLSQKTNRKIDYEVHE